MVRPVREKKPTNHYDPAKEASKPQWKGNGRAYDFGNGDIVIISDSEDEMEEEEYYLNDATTVCNTTLTTEAREALKREQEMKRDAETQTDKTNRWSRDAETQTDN
jgi:hypothetical protein